MVNQVSEASPIKVTRISENSEQHALSGWKRLTAAAKEAQGGGDANLTGWKKIIAAGKAARDAERLALGSTENPLSVTTTTPPPSAAAMSKPSLVAMVNRSSSRLTVPAAVESGGGADENWTTERLQQAAAELTTIMSNAVKQLAVIQAQLSKLNNQSDVKNRGDRK